MHSIKMCLTCNYSTHSIKLFFEVYSHRNLRSSESFCKEKYPQNHFINRLFFYRMQSATVRITITGDIHVMMALWNICTTKNWSNCDKFGSVVPRTRLIDAVVVLPIRSNWCKNNRRLNLFYWLKCKKLFLLNLYNRQLFLHQFDLIGTIPNGVRLTSDAW